MARRKKILDAGNGTHRATFKPRRNKKTDLMHVDDFRRLLVNVDYYINNEDKGKHKQYFKYVIDGLNDILSEYDKIHDFLRGFTSVLIYFRHMGLVDLKPTSQYPYMYVSKKGTPFDILSPRTPDELIELSAKITELADKLPQEIEDN